MIKIFKNRKWTFKEKLKFFYSVNWIKTLYFNFKKFPYPIAKKLPVFFYENVKFSNLSGEIIINAPITTGMIGFGQKFEQFSRSKGVGELVLSGKLIFNGHAHFGKDVFIFIGKNAVAQFGYMACLGSNVKFLCFENIVLGKWTGIGYESQLSDSNYHPFKDLETEEVTSMIKPIFISNYNSFSSRITVLPGTKTPEHCIVASNSLCSSDYTKYGENILIGGIPAKLIRNNYIRDWDSEKEALLKSKVLFR
jgi:acetyltransferase-like isoleucine patch superfamily enzyme